MSVARLAAGVSTVLLLVAAPGAALVYTFSNTTAGTVSQAATPCSNPLVRTFSVSESFAVSTIALGFNITHPNRGDIRGVLVAPNGSSFQFLTESGDPDNNYDVLFSSNNEGVLDDGDTDPVGAPRYNRLVAVAGMNFYSGNGIGTWTLRVCDTTSANSGTFNSARLVLSSTAPAVGSCTGTVTYDWGANGNGSLFTSATAGDVTISQETTADFAGTGTTEAFRTNTSAQGAHAGFYQLSMDASLVAGTQDSEAVGLVTRFSFSRPVNDLAFSLLDVDTSSGAWEDLISVEGKDASGAITPFAFTPAGPDTQLAGDVAEGDGTTPPSSLNANVEVVFQGPVQSLTVSYSQSDSPTAENAYMVVGISDFSFCAYDYGDAPATYGTTLAGGARHVLSGRNLYLGRSRPDGEADGQPGTAATTDDTVAVVRGDDEDGVASFPAYAGGSGTYTVSLLTNNLSATQGATLVGYIDWNRDGDFTDANEISGSVAVPAGTVNGTYNVTWTNVPANAGGTASTYARFRISHTASEVLSPTGAAASGEVEDYQIPAGTLPVTLAAFHAEETAGGLRVRWTTETATSTVGYRILALGPGGAADLTRKLVPARATDSLAPESYVVDLAAGDLPARGVTALLLVDLDTRGTATRHGPFRLGQAYGEIPQRHAIDWSSIRREAELEGRFARAGADRQAGFPIAELRVSEEGIHRLTYEDLLAAGLDFSGAPAAQLALVLGRTGAPVPLHVETGRGGKVGPGSFVEFYGLPVTDSLHTRERVYRLVVSPGEGLRPRTVPAQPKGTALPEYVETEAVERDLEYSFASPNGDPWYEARVLANGGAGQRDFPIVIDGLTRSEGILEVDLWGVTDWPGTEPDHHVQLRLNGQLVAEERFDGLTARSYQVPLPGGLLADGENVLTVRLPGGTGFPFDLVHVDGYRLTYPRRPTARGGKLSFAGTEGHVVVDGISHADVVAWASGGTQRLTGLQVRPVKRGYRVGLQLPKAGRGSSAAEVSTVRALLMPQVSAARSVPDDLLRGSADYLVVSHPAFLGGLDPLISARQAQGLSVKVVDVLDLYVSYSGGEVDPEAIRSYVRDAAGELGTRFVLLVGGDTYDPFDNLGLGSLSFLPTLYVPTDDLIRYSPADPLFGDVDGDGLPEIPVGRFPVRTRAELDFLITKTLAYPSTPATALFAADGDYGELFSTLSEDLVSRVPLAWPVQRAYMDDLGLAGARAALLEGLAAGPALVSFVGHSGPTVWSFQGLFSNGDADALPHNGNPALVMQLGCWNSYHVAPAYDTLAHRLLLAGPRGAAAVLGSATLSKVSSDRLIGPAVTEGLFVPGKTVGEAMVEAKRAIAAQGGDLRDVIVGWTLLGDPALVVAP